MNDKFENKNVSIFFKHSMKAHSGNHILSHHSTKNIPRAHVRKPTYSSAGTNSCNEESVDEVLLEVSFTFAEELCKSLSDSLGKELSGFSPEFSSASMTFRLTLSSELLGTNTRPADC